MHTHTHVCTHTHTHKHTQTHTHTHANTHTHTHTHTHMHVCTHTHTHTNTHAHTHTQTHTHTHTRTNTHSGLRQHCHMPGIKVTQPFANYCKTSDPMWSGCSIATTNDLCFCVVEQLKLDFYSSTLKLWFILVYTVLLLLFLLFAQLLLYCHVKPLCYVFRKYT